MDTNLVSKKAKIGPSYSEKWHWTYKKKKKNPFLRFKLETGVPNTKKLSGIPFFMFTNKKTVFKNSVPNKPNLTIFLKIDKYYT